jgi:hypothetical protein
VSVFRHPKGPPAPGSPGGRARFLLSAEILSNNRYLVEHSKLFFARCARPTNTEKFRGLIKIANKFFSVDLFAALVCDIVLKEKVYGCGR